MTEHELTITRAFDAPRELVYRAWWFTVLMSLLAANILCAALKKFPWKRHQTGFLITHAGLLIVIGGSWWAALGARW